jgi:hypothetical protein
MSLSRSVSVVSTSLPPPYDLPATSGARQWSDTSSSVTSATSSNNTIPENSVPSGAPTLISNPFPDPAVPGTYPAPDPFVEAIEHNIKLQKLCTKCQDGDKLRTLHMGEIIVALTQLLRKARQLDALDPEEEIEQIEKLVR